MNIKKVLIGFVAVCLIIVGILYAYEYNSKPKLTTIYVSDDKETPSDSVASKESDWNKGSIKVYITGEVNIPGVYEMEEGDRIDDLLGKAGGHTEDADLSTINLAKYIQDAEKIVIPKIGDEVDKSDLEAQNIDTGSDLADINSGLIDINTAGKQTLMSLPGIGDVLSENIIKYRESSGNFKTIEEIKNVPRIGSAIFENIRDLITVNGGAN